VPWHNSNQHVLSQHVAHFMKTVPQPIQASSSTRVDGRLVKLEYEDDTVQHLIHTLCSGSLLFHFPCYRLPNCGKANT
jgi:hypothetical protein